MVARKRPVYPSTMGSSFLRYNSDRLKDLIGALPAKEARVVMALPRILDHLHPLLPGSSDADTPHGIAGERYWDDEPSFRSLFPQISRMDPPPKSPFRALFALGSPGSVFFTSASDLDMWLLGEDDALDAYDLEKIRARLRAIEKWAEGEGVEIHIFVHKIGSIRDNSFREDSEFAGDFASTLKEEFFRSALLLAGHPPTFWDVDSPDAIDLGDIPHLSRDAYLGAALHFLEKALERPFKTALKATLLRCYADKGEEAWVATRLKNEVLAGRSPDPYLVSLQVLQEYLSGRKEEDVFVRIKEALYLKLVSEETMEGRRRWAKDRLVAAGFQRIGPAIDLETLDAFPNRPLEERWRFVEGLSKLLEQGMRHAISGATGARLSPTRLRSVARRFELHLAPPAPRIPIGRGGDLRSGGEPVVTFLQEKSGFALTVERVVPNQPLRPELILRRSTNLWELLGYAVANKVLSPERTEIHILPRDAGPKRLHEILGLLRDFFSGLKSASAEDLLAPARPLRHLVLIGKPKATEVSWYEADTWGTVSHRFFEGPDALSQAATAILANRAPAPVTLFSDSPPPIELEPFANFLTTSSSDAPDAIRGFLDGKALWLSTRGGGGRFTTSREALAFLAGRVGPFERYHPPGRSHSAASALARLPGEILSRAPRGEVALFLHPGEAFVLDDARRACVFPWPESEDAHLLRRFNAFVQGGMHGEERSWVRLRVFRIRESGGDLAISPEDPGPHRPPHEAIGVFSHEKSGVFFRIGNDTLPPGPSLFAEAAARIRSFRQDPRFYPAYVSFVAFPPSLRGRATLVDYLRLKRQVEERLSRDLRALYK